MISRGIKVGNVEALQQQRSLLVNQQLVQNLTKLLGLGAGAGLLARGAQGAYNLGRRALSSPHTLKPTTIAVPVHEEEEKLASLGDFAAGSAASDWTGHPMALPGAAAATIGGAVGSWKLLDYVLDRRRKQLMKSELETTKQQYEQALLAQHDKRASALGQDLDQLFDLLQEKQAGTWGDTAGQAAGLATLGAGGIALLSGAITHNIGSKRRRQALLQKALRKRRREQAQSAPTRIFAVPQPMSPAGSMNTAPTEDDLNGNPLDKTAARGLLAAAQNVLRPPQPATPAKSVSGSVPASPVPGAL